jgi:deazaflavin-dependent oxidoreductase (nitroreductase family)
MHHLDKIAVRLSGGKTTAANILTGLPTVTLTTTGARSGKERSVPLISFPDGDKLIFVASNWGQQGHPSWYYNLRANPEATVSFQGQSKEYIVHEAAGSDWERYWDQVVDAHAGYAAYKQRANGRQIPIMVCAPKNNPPIKDLADG